MTPDIIESARNPRLKRLKALSTPRLRAKEALVLVEGARFVATALALGGEPRLVVCTPEIEQQEGTLLERLDQAGAEVAIAPADLLAGISDTQAPQGLLAAFAEPAAPAPIRGEGLWLILDRVRDPGNVGTLLRSAAAAGVHGVCVLTGTADPYAAKCVRASAGTVFAVPIVRLGLDEALTRFAEAGVRMVVADADGACGYDAFAWSDGPVALVLGNEAGGPAESLREAACAQLRIPMPGRIESLNVATAGTVILFEAIRQRRPELV